MIVWSVVWLLALLLTGVCVVIYKVINFDENV